MIGDPRTIRRARGAEIGFDALRIEGALLAADWLGKVAQLQATFQTEAAYGVPKGLNLRDEIGRYWRIAQAHWAELTAGRATGSDPAALGDRFVLGVLREAFGFSPSPSGRGWREAPGEGISHESTLLSPESSPSNPTHPIRHFAQHPRVPVIIAPAGTGLDTPSPEFGDGHRRRSAFGLLQEFLNASNDALWGLACDGLTLRIARDNASLTRPAWIEADLSRIFTEHLYPDFAALWLLIHESRFGQPEQPPESCALELWRIAGREAGTQARDRLSDGFEKAVETLGQGFLAHPVNSALRSALHGGQLTKEAYFGQLLRLVYRLIFLLTVEERGLLHVKDTPDVARELYAEGYSMQRMRDRSTRRSAHDRNIDQWEAVKIVFRGLAEGEPWLGLPALAGLFGPKQCPDLDRARLENRALLTACFQLCWLSEPAGLVRVNWRDMGPDELGYVYEGLLELVPKIADDGRRFSFAGTDESRGHARKTSGSYYTPDELVQVLLGTALEPVIARTITANPARPAEALLEIAVVDPTCGSGHFLLAAARRLAEHVARLRTEGTPTAEDYRHALREVVRHCIYGVDMNPLAVELCKVSLWMESLDPGLPLTFLEAHIRYGNSLLGTTAALMGDGVPDAAWVALEGDDKAVTRILKKRNKDQLVGQRPFVWQDSEGGETLQHAMKTFETVPDTDSDALAKKERQWEELLASQAYQHAQLVADAWCAAFLWPKERHGSVTEAAPTSEVWRALRYREGPPSPVLIETIRNIAKQYALFHWELAFPQVFERGGFDVLLGNPPWDQLELKEEEFFASRQPDIANALNADSRKKMIAALPATNPVLWEDWQFAKRSANGEMHLARNSGRYPLCAVGRINSYALFAEHNWRVLCAEGRAGFITPSGIVTDETTKEFFQALVSGRVLHSVYHFENEDRVFRGLHHAYRFVLMTIGHADSGDFLFYARRAADLGDPERHFTLSAHDTETLNPNTRTCPTFRSRRDATLNLALYRRVGVLLQDDEPNGNPWGLRFMQGTFNMASDSALFRTKGELIAAGWKLDGNHFMKDGKLMLPLGEAKMFHHYDHRFGSYAGQTDAQARQGKLPEIDEETHQDAHFVTFPKYWIDEAESEERLAGRWDRGWLLGWRNITRTTDARTVLAAVVPREGVGHSNPLMFPAEDARAVACLYANLCSFALDYAARQKVGGINLTYSYLKQFPVLPPSRHGVHTPWDSAVLVRDWLLPRVLELTYTAWDLKSFAEDCGEEGPPYRWDADRRFQLKSEIDAAFFHLYGLSHDDVGYIMDTFPVVHNNDIGTHGEFRTKRAVLEIYEALAGAAATGVPYVSPLGPPRRAQ